MTTLKMTPSELVLGDKVQVVEGPFGWGTVVEITDEIVKVFRPYVHISDFTYTGGVLHYVGHEYVTYFRDSRRAVEVDAHTHDRMMQPGALK